MGNAAQRLPKSRNSFLTHRLVERKVGLIGADEVMRCINYSLIEFESWISARTQAQWNFIAIDIEPDAEKRILLILNMTQPLEKRHGIYPFTYIE
jgi:hypothetical protein